MGRANDTTKRHASLPVREVAASALHVRVVSSSRVVATALSLLVAELGFSVASNTSSEADIDLVDVRGSAAPHATESDPPAVALLGELDDPVLVLRAGFRGYIRPEDAPQAVARAMHAVAEGQVWGERSILQRLILEPEPAEPTFREAEVLQLLVRGSSNRDIAHRLGISVSTVKAHVSSLFDKFGVDSRLELVTQYYAGDHPLP